jgi:hypothetical protein
LIWIEFIKIIGYDRAKHGISKVFKPFVVDVFTWKVMIGA